MVSRHSPHRRSCLRLSVDELVKGTEWASRQHADYIYILGGKAVVVEETGRPEHRDIGKVRESIEILRAGGILGGVEVVAGIVHYRRGDTMFNKMIASEASRKPPILPANCYTKLRTLLIGLLGCTPQVS